MGRKIQEDLLHDVQRDRHHLTRTERTEISLKLWIRSFQTNTDFGLMHPAVSTITLSKLTYNRILYQDYTNTK